MDDTEKDTDPEETQQAILERLIECCDKIMESSPESLWLYVLEYENEKPVFEGMDGIARWAMVESIDGKSTGAILTKVTETITPYSLLKLGNDVAQVIREINDGRILAPENGIVPGAKIVGKYHSFTDDLGYARDERNIDSYYAQLVVYLSEEQARQKAAEWYMNDAKTDFQIHSSVQLQTEEKKKQYQNQYYDTLDI